jgi:ribosomal protein S18 acetylase RimI-like enzyme
VKDTYFDSEAHLRLAQENDRSSLYYVCLATGDSGENASHLFRQPDMLGEIYAGPYLTFQPDLAFALETDQVVGYVLGALDTEKFESIEEEKWWPHLRDKYGAQPLSSYTSIEQSLLVHIANPLRTSKEVIKKYPSHLHIDMIEAFQSKGYGKKMIGILLGELRILGSHGVHLRMSATNERAFKFYEKMGFETIANTEDERMLACSL